MLIRVEDTGGLSDTDLFEVTVVGNRVTVSISGNQVCSGLTSGVERCFDIKPESALDATVRFYFDEAERIKLCRLFRDMYTEARTIAIEKRNDGMQQELNDIANAPVLDRDGMPVLHPVTGQPLLAPNSSSVQLAKLQLDAFKWQAATERPRKYGTVQRNEVTGKDGGPLDMHVNVSSEELKAATEAILSKL